MAEQFANNARTAVAVAAGPADLALTVADGAPFPALAPFRVLVGTEIMIVTDGAGTATWTVTRGAEGTAPGAHAIGARVDHVVTAGALAQIVADAAAAGSSLPAVGDAGDVLTVVAGEWAAAPAPSGGGGGGGAFGAELLGAIVAPADAGYSWVNQDGATLTATDGVLTLAKAGAGNSNSVTARVKALPAPPYTVTALIDAVILSQDWIEAGLVLRASAGTGLLTFGYRYWATNGGLLLTADYRTSPNVDWSNRRQVALPSQRLRWLRLADNGTDRIYSLSNNGRDWIEFYRVARTVDLTPDQVGIFVHTRQAAAPNYATALTVYSWAEA